MIEIYLLEQLKALYEYGTLSATAERLHVAQPSVSRAMKKLEEQLGTG
jgi:DNA-binding transcriptional LysR family regulator